MEFRTYHPSFESQNNQSLFSKLFCDEDVGYLFIVAKIIKMKFCFVLMSRFLEFSSIKNGVDET